MIPGVSGATLAQLASDRFEIGNFGAQRTGFIGRFGSLVEATALAQL